MKINEDLLNYGLLDCKNLGRWNASTDLDNLQIGETCFWNTSDMPANVPFTGGRCYCFQGYSNLKYQMCFQYNTDNVAVRHTWNGVWSDWGTCDLGAQYLKFIGSTEVSAITKNTYRDINISTLNIPTTGNGKLFLVNVYCIHHGSFYASSIFYIYNGAIQSSFSLYDNSNISLSRGSSTTIRITNKNTAIDMPASIINAIPLS